jgi:hypothetical protein
MDSRLPDAGSEDNVGVDLDVRLVSYGTPSVEITQLAQHF